MTSANRNLIVISGPSGVGKSTLLKQVLTDFTDLQFSVSHTTRERRVHETHGRDYWFVTKAEFERMIAGNEFVEWAHVHEQLYGTSWHEVDEKSCGDRTLVLDIDVQGARAVRDRFPEAMLIMLLPPSLPELKRRLLQREQRIDHNVKERLQTAIAELRQYEIYDYLLINDDIKQAHDQLHCLLTGFRLSMPRQRAAVERILGDPS